MHSFSAMPMLVFVGLGIAMPTAASLADGPGFILAPANNGTQLTAPTVDSFASELAVFNRHAVTDLLVANTVTMVKYDTAWPDGADMDRAMGLLTRDAQSIDLLRQALKASAAAMTLLAQNHLDLKQVIGIVPDGSGGVFLYFS